MKGTAARPRRARTPSPQVPATPSSRRHTAPERRSPRVPTPRPAGTHVGLVPRGAPRLRSTEQLAQLLAQHRLCGEIAASAPGAEQGAALHRVSDPSRPRPSPSYPSQGRPPPPAAAPRAPTRPSPPPSLPTSYSRTRILPAEAPPPTAAAGGHFRPAPVALRPHAVTASHRAHADLGRGYRRLLRAGWHGPGPSSKPGKGGGYSPFLHAPAALQRPCPRVGIGWGERGALQSGPLGSASGQQGKAKYRQGSVVVGTALLVRFACSEMGEATQGRWLGLPSLILHTQLPTCPEHCTCIHLYKVES